MDERDAYIFLYDEVIKTTIVLNSEELISTQIKREIPDKLSESCFYVVLFGSSSERYESWNEILPCKRMNISIEPLYVPVKYLNRLSLELMLNS